MHIKNGGKLFIKEAIGESRPTPSGRPIIQSGRPFFLLGFRNPRFFSVKECGPCLNIDWLACMINSYGQVGNSQRVPFWAASSSALRKLSTPPGVFEFLNRNEAPLHLSL